jgi:hypothetical protein
MLRFLTVACILPVLGLPALAKADSSPPTAAEIDKLIQQLGSRRFKEREAASKALDKVGKPALEALRRAARDDADAEVRRRAGVLVERMDQRLAPVLARRILDSDLSLVEKARRLRRFIKTWMARDQVRAIFGQPNFCAADMGHYEEPYDQFRLCIDYGSGGAVRAVLERTSITWRCGPLTTDPSENVPFGDVVHVTVGAGFAASRKVEAQAVALQLVGAPPQRAAAVLIGEVHVDALQPRRGPVAERRLARPVLATGHRGASDA